MEDTAEAAIHFKNGCLYSLYATNSYASDAPVYLEFQGEKGRCGLKQDIGFYELDGSYKMCIRDRSMTGKGISNGSPFLPP